jgi:hypothetical protein
MGFLEGIKTSFKRTALSIKHTAQKLIIGAVRRIRGFARDTYIMASHIEEDIATDIKFLESGLERWDKSRLKLKEEIEAELPPY